MLPDNTWGPATVLVVVLIIVGAIAGAVGVFLTDEFTVQDFLDWVWKAALGAAGLGGARAAYVAAKKR